MPTQVRSLFGFLSQPLGLAYLNMLLADRTLTNKRMRTMWEEARSRISEWPENFGHPDILDIEAEHAPYLDSVANSVRFGEAINGLNFRFALVEIAPILAVQWHVSAAKSTNIASNLDLSTRENQLILCLPNALDNISYTATLLPSSLVIESNDLNLRLFPRSATLNLPDQGVSVGGMMFGAAISAVQVVHFNGRHYLKNGYHRACRLQDAGLTHMPCILVEANQFQDVGFAPGTGFEQALLESNRPPVCGHFREGIGYPLEFKTSKIRFTLTWRAETLLD